MFFFEEKTFSSFKNASLPNWEGAKYAEVAGRLVFLSLMHFKKVIKRKILEWISENWECQNFENEKIKGPEYCFGSYSFTLLIEDNYCDDPKLSPIFLTTANYD